MWVISSRKVETTLPGTISVTTSAFNVSLAMPR